MAPSLAAVNMLHRVLRPLLVDIPIDNQRQVCWYVQYWKLKRTEGFGSDESRFGVDL